MSDFNELTIEQLADSKPQDLVNYIDQLRSEASDKELSLRKYRMEVAEHLQVVTSSVQKISQALQMQQSINQHLVQALGLAMEMSSILGDYKDGTEL